MMVILMRHGDASGGENDFIRPLSLTGLQEVSVVAEKISQLDFKIDRLVSSPLLRAKQTREQVLNKLDYIPEKLVSNFLTPDSDSTFWLRELSICKQNIMLVGHLPFLGILAGELLQLPMVGFNTADALIMERVGSNYYILNHVSCE